MSSQLVHKYPNARVKASSAQRQWPGLLAELLVHPAGRVGSFAAGATELTVVIQGFGSVCRQLDGGEPQRISAQPGAMWLTPAGVREHFIDFESAMPEVLHLHIAWDRFNRVCPAEGPCRTAIAGLRRDAPFGDTLVEAVARAVSAGLQDPAGQSVPLMSALSMCLAARLLHDHADAREGGRGRQAAGLDGPRLEKVKQHVARHLADDLSVGELAKVACLSPSRFAHVFKMATGETPEQYVSALRIELAKGLLIDSPAPLAEIACACGFSNQASFTKAFVRAQSEPPGRYRRTHSARPARG